MSHQRFTDEDSSPFSAETPVAGQQDDKASLGTTSNSIQQNAPSETSSASGSTCPVLNLTVRTLTGQGFPIGLPYTGSERVLDLKNKIEAVHGIPASFQRLIYSGRELIDSNTLAFYGLQEWHVLHLVLRQNNPQQNNQYGQVNAIAVRHEADGRPVEPYEALAAPLAQGPIEDPQRMIDAWQLGRAVKMFAIVDCVFLLIWSFSYWPLAIAVFLAICGYYGALHYRLPFVIMYVIYLLLSIGLRVYWMTRGENFLMTLILILGVLIEFYILNITMKFISLLKVLTPQERQELIAMRSAAFPIV